MPFNDHHWFQDNCIQTIEIEKSAGENEIENEDKSAENDDGIKVKEKELYVLVGEGYANFIQIYKLNFQA